MDPTTQTTDAQAGGSQEAEGDSVPVLLAKAAALSATIDGQAAQLAAELGRQLAGLHGMQPAAPQAAPVTIDPSMLVVQAQEAMVATIDRLRSLAEEMGVASQVAAGGVALDPLGGLLAGLAGHAQAQLGGHAGMVALEPTASPPDVDIKAILTSAQAAQDQALRAAHELFAGLGLDPADPTAGLALRMPHAPAASPATVPSGMPGGDLLGSMQADTQRLQAMLSGLFTKIVPPP